MVNMHREIGKGCLQRERNGTWTMRLMVDGRSINRNTGTRNRAEAGAMLRELVREQAELRREREASMRILCEWGALKPRLEAAGVDEAGIARRRAVWRFFADWMHERHPEVAGYAGVTEGMAEEYLRFMLERNTATSRNTHLYALRGMFDALHGGGDWANPWNRMGRHPVSRHSRRALSKGEIERLLAAAGEEGDEWRTLFLLGAGTGQGLKGCCALTWGDIGLRDRNIRIGGSDGTVHVIGMNGSLHAALTRMSAAGGRGCVLANIADMRRRRSAELGKTLSRIFARAGIETSVRIEGRRRGSPDASFMSLRCSFIEHAARSGVSLADVKAIVGSKCAYVGRLYRQATGRPTSRERPQEQGGDAYAALASRLAEMGELLRLGLVSRREYDKTCGRMCRQARRGAAV